MAPMTCQCLDYFASLAKLGSVNSKPVQKFMLAMKRPSSEAFKKAIDACSEAGMVHLEAMSREHYAAFLFGQNNEALGNDYIMSSYWLYQDWGAHAKALQLYQRYDFLKVSLFLKVYCFTHARFTLLTLLCSCCRIARERKQRVLLRVQH